MRIDGLAGETKSRNGQAMPNLIHPGHRAIGILNKRLFLEIILAAAESFLGSAKAQFEPAQSFVGKRGSAQMQPGAAESRAVFDTLPHGEVIGAKMLEGIIRSAELVERLASVTKEDERGNWPGLQIRCRNKPFARLQEEPGNVCEEPKRLRRQAETFASFAMQAIE